MCSPNVLFLAISEKGKLFFREFQDWSAREVKPSCPKGNLKQEKYQTACKPGSVSARLERRMAIHLGRPLPDASRDLPGRRRENPLAGETPACRPYLVLLPVGFTVPSPLPGTRCALTAPFHPCRHGPKPKAGGLLSVALSLESPPPGVTRHRVPVEPGLSSPRGIPEGGHPAV